MLLLVKELLDQVALAVEFLAETGLPLAVALRRDAGGGALVMSQLSDAVGIIIVGLGFRFVQSQNATAAARLAAVRKFLASLS